MDEKIVFTTEDGEDMEFYILEETTISGVNYLLVTDSDEEEADALIFRERSSDDNETTYDVVDDDEELKAISKVFEELLEDIDININD